MMDNVIDKFLIQQVTVQPCWDGPPLFNMVCQMFLSMLLCWMQNLRDDAGWSVHYAMERKSVIQGRDAS